MTTFVLEDQEVSIPAWVVDHDSFRRWARSEDFPQRGQVCFLKPRVWVDMSKEQIFSHNQAKGELAIVLGSLVKSERLGRFFHDNVLFSNVKAGLSCSPDGLFVSKASFAQGRVRLVRGARGGYVELEGTPDMVLDVVSTSSQKKDTVILFDSYCRAGIPEYWLVDARRSQLGFDILRRTSEGYVAARKKAGWQDSAVFDKSFKLTVGADELGYPEYTLSVRES